MKKTVGKTYRAGDMDVGDRYKHEGEREEYERIPDGSDVLIRCLCIVSGSWCTVGTRLQTCKDSIIVYLGTAEHPNSNV